MHIHVHVRVTAVCDMSNRYAVCRSTHPERLWPLRLTSHQFYMELTTTGVHLRYLQYIHVQWTLLEGIYVIQMYSIQDIQYVHQCHLYCVHVQKNQICQLGDKLKRWVRGINVHDLQQQLIYHTLITIMTRTVQDTACILHTHYGWPSIHRAAWGI